MPKLEKPKPDALGDAREVMRRMLATPPTPHEVQRAGDGRKRGKAGRGKRAKGRAG